jgi:hypothetical protein
VATNFTGVKANYPTPGQNRVNGEIMVIYGYLPGKLQLTRAGRMEIWQCQKAKRYRSTEFDQDEGYLEIEARP